MVKPGVYRHYKGRFYKVITTAKHSENLEDYVVYQQLYGNLDFWIRPKIMFEEEVTIEGRKLARFTYISEEHQL